jgi:hypothetical protein
MMHEDHADLDAPEHDADTCSVLCVCGHKCCEHASAQDHLIYCCVMGCACTRYDEAEDGDDGND